MSQFNHKKYLPCNVLHRPHRLWADKINTKAPIWCSVDLRDGNQALIDPMTPEQKVVMFEMLVEVGFKQIEIGFPAASQTDFDFVRMLVEEQRIPDDVTVQVLTQARQSLIERTFESLRGVKQAVLHVYNSTSTIQREQVFKASKEQVKEIAVNGAKWVKLCAQQYPETQWTFQYSPESFTGTETDYAVEVCNAVSEVWQPTPENKVIYNLPATVEVSTPNVYADQVEYFCEHIAHRDALIISLHTHNDRGCAVAAAELGVLAGADRVEGTLLGNGERTGNMDIVTMGMNLYSQGVDPELDFSRMDNIIHVVERCTALKVHPRHPYAGELVFAAFSGSHQDAINKCLQLRKSPEEIWQVAYLPIDPGDLGRDYQEVIRINSQSGKGGIAYVLDSGYGIKVPRWMQVDFSPIVQKHADTSKAEVGANTIFQLFESTYLCVESPYSVQSYTVRREDGVDKMEAIILDKGQQHRIVGSGKGVLEAFVEGLSLHLAQSVAIINYNEHALNKGEDSEAIAYVQVSLNNRRVCAAGKSRDILGATLNAVLNAVARL